MSKKKKRGSSSEKKNAANEIKLEGETIVEQFNNFIAEPRRVSDLIRFIAIQNARLLGEMSRGELSDERKQDVVSFYYGFMEEFGEISHEARMENWGQEPLIFRVAESILEDIWVRNLQEYFAALTPYEQREAETLMETLMGVRHQKHIFLAFNGDYETFDIPATLPKFDLHSTKEALKLICGNVIHERGSVIMHVFSDKGEAICGFRVIEQTGMWHPVSKEEIEYAYCTTPSGLRMEPEEGQYFDVVPRERF